MSSPSIEEIFGSFASQDVSNVHFSKRNLEEVGLEKVDEQSPQGIFTAIFLKAMKILNPIEQGNNPDINITIQEDFSSLVDRNARKYREFQYTVKFQVIDEEADLSPSDF